MYLTNSTVRRIASSLVRLRVVWLAARILAKKPSAERKPDVSNKALITKQTPVTKKDSKGPKQYTIEQFMATTRIGGASFSSDEKSILFHSNKSGIFNVY